MFTKTPELFLLWFETISAVECHITFIVLKFSVVTVSVIRMVVTCCKLCCGMLQKFRFVTKHSSAAILAMAVVVSISTIVIVYERWRRLLWWIYSNNILY